jgi:integrase
MHARIRGLNSKTKTLASGETVTYWYAGKGGPRLPGEPGSPEFMVAYNEAMTARREPPAGVLLSLMAGYQQSEDFKGLSPRSRVDYVKQIKKIEAEFIDFPLTALADRRTRGEFLAWRDRMAVASRRQADYAFSVLARILSWARNRGLITVNPCEKAGRLYHGSRAENVWTDADEATFLASAPAHLHLPMILALWSGQRQGDLLRLPWSAYDGRRIRLQQSKTGVRVEIPVGAPLKAALDRTERKSPIMLVNSAGKPWTSDGFSVSWRKAVIKAEIATLTGHTLRDVRAILDAHYLDRDPALGESAIRKLERRTKTPD